MNTFVSMRFTRKELEDIYDLLGHSDHPSVWAKADKLRAKIRQALEDVQ